MQSEAFVFALLLCASVAVEFEDYFKDCHPNSASFDTCVREGLNKIQPYYKTGLPKYNILPFDPFFAKEIKAQKGISRLGFTLTLRNVTESGWTNSKVTKFKSDLNNHKIVYTQSFPKKTLWGNYEFNASFFGSSRTIRGKFTLILYDLIQMTTVTKLPGQKVRAEMDVQIIGNMEIHVTNLFSKQSVSTEPTILENIVDKIINTAWQPGFVMTRNVINELVSKAFTEIFEEAFHDFPFEKIFKPKPSSN